MGGCFFYLTFILTGFNVLSKMTVEFTRVQTTIWFGNLRVAKAFLRARYDRYTYIFLKGLKSEEKNVYLQSTLCYTLLYTNNYIFNSPVDIVYYT